MGRNRAQTRSYDQRVMHSLPITHCLRCGGYSLIEVLIAMVAGAVVLSATIQSFSRFQHRLLDQQAAIARHQDLRIGLAVMTSELRLAGVGGEILGARLQTAEPSEIAFWANLGDLSTFLTGEASAVDLELAVSNGSAWPKGKRVIVCGVNTCAESHLARRGTSRALHLTDALQQIFPAGSQVVVANEVRYYLGKDQQGRPSLMRKIDRGAGSLIGDVARFHLTYLDREGGQTDDPAHVARVRVEIVVGEGGRVIRHDVRLR